MEESVTLDNGGFTALELNSRTLNTKNSFLKKNGSRCALTHTFRDWYLDLYRHCYIVVTCVWVFVSRSPPRPSPGGLHYSDEDICNNYNGAVLTESTTLTEKHTEVSESEVFLSLSPSARLSVKVCQYIGLKHDVKKKRVTEAAQSDFDFNTPQTGRPGGLCRLCNLSVQRPLLHVIPCVLPHFLSYIYCFEPPIERTAQI